MIDMNGGAELYSCQTRGDSKAIKIRLTGIAYVFSAPPCTLRGQHSLLTPIPASPAVFSSGGSCQ